jgi:hypothetical protein
MPTEENEMPLQSPDQAPSNQQQSVDPRWTAEVLTKSTKSFIDEVRSDVISLLEEIESDLDIVPLRPETASNADVASQIIEFHRTEVNRISEDRRQIRLNLKDRTPFRSFGDIETIAQAASLNSKEAERLAERQKQLNLDYQSGQPLQYPPEYRNGNKQQVSARNGLH